MNSQFKKLFYFLLLLILIRLCFSSFFNFSLPITQLIIFPVLCVIIYVLIPKNYNLLKLLLIVFSLTGFSLSLNSEFKFFSPQGTIFISRLAGDTDDSLTSDFINKIPKYQAQENISPAILDQYFKEISTPKDATSFLTKHSKATALVFGSKRWLQVAVNDTASSATFFRDSKQFDIINNVPFFGLSVDPLPATVRFLGLFLTAKQQKDSSIKVALLLSAANIKAGWTTHSHLAYAKWLAATTILSEPQASIQELYCSYKLYKEAQSYFRSKDNLLLLAAIINNKSIAAHSLYLAQKNIVETPSMLVNEINQVLKLLRGNKVDLKAKKIFTDLLATRNNLKITQPKRVKKKSFKINA